MVGAITVSQAEEILEELEEKMDSIISSGTLCGSVADEPLNEFAAALEEYGDVIEGVKLYELLAPSIYEMVSFIRTNRAKIKECGEPIWGMFKSMAHTMSDLHHTLHDYDDINKRGFYDSFENDCNMLKDKVMGAKSEAHQSLDNILNF